MSADSKYLTLNLRPLSVLFQVLYFLTLVYFIIVTIAVLSDRKHPFTEMGSGNWFYIWPKTFSFNEDLACIRVTRVQNKTYWIQLATKNTQ